jgi:hypothetical protein
LFDIDRQVQNNATLAAGEVLSTHAQVAASHNASNLAFRSLSAERSRYNVGEGSLLDTLLIEEQLSTARQQEVLSRVSFINAIANLRFQSGTILTPDSGHTPSSVAFAPNAFRSIPDWSSILLPDPAPGAQELDSTIERPRPLFEKWFADRAEVRDHKQAIKPVSYYQSIQDAKQRQAMAAAAKYPPPVIVSSAKVESPPKVSTTTSSTTKVSTTTTTVVTAPPTKPGKTVVVSPAPGTGAAVAEPPVANPPPARPKGLLQKLFK